MNRGKPSLLGTMHPYSVKVTNHPQSIAVLVIALLSLALSLFPSINALASPLAEDDVPTAAQVIEAVNSLRTKSGLPALSMHPVLMQVAQTEANGIANGMGGHWRPNGMSLGEWLISLGYPLAGDLTQDGYRSENWIAANNAKQAIQAWKGDGAHSNTMLSADRSDLGVGIAVGDQVYIVLITALQTSSGEMQSAAYPILTQVSSSSSAAQENVQSQYIKPIVMSTARSNGDVFHKIEYGQSLWSIAIAYHTTIDQMRAWNSLGEDTTIYEGQVLLVQRNATPPPTVTGTATAESPQPVMTGTATPPSVLPVALPTMVIESSTDAGNESPVAIPGELRTWIIAGAVVIGVVLSLFLNQRGK